MLKDVEILALARKHADNVSKDRSVNQEFLDGFVTNGTTEDLCCSICKNGKVRPGHSFMGAVRLTDMPFSGNAECKIDVIESSVGGFILALELISATEEPYRWHGTYWNDFDGWKGIITETDLEPKENIANRITAISDSSTDSEYPTAKAVYSLVQSLKNDLEARITALAEQIATGGKTDET